MGGYDQDEKVVEIMRNFRFLRELGYRETEVSVGHRENPSLSYRNVRLGLEIKILGSKSSWDVVFIKKGFSLFKKRPSAFAVSDSFDQFDTGMIKGRPYSLKAFSDFVQSHLMPIVKGEKWITDYAK